MKKLNFSNLKGDFLGGFSSGLVTLLECIPYGLIAFAPLGAEYTNLGIIAAIYGAIFAGFFASLFGGTPALVTVPAPATCLMFSYIILGLMDTQLLDPSVPGYIFAILTLSFFTLFLSGIIQLMMGVLKADYLIKFISYPVIAGIISGIGVLIVKTQIWHLLGIHHQGNLLGILDHLDEIKYWNLFIGIVTAVLFWNKSRLMRGALGFLAVIAIGTGIYYLLFLKQ